MALDIEALARRYWPMVMRRCLQLLRNEDDARDVSQDVFVQLLRYQDRLDLRCASSLLYRIATNLCLNRIRDRGRHTVAAERAFLERVAAVDEDHGARLEARSILGRLFGAQPASTRVIAVLHYLDGLSLEDVAAEVGLSVSGVRKRLRGLRAMLHEMEAR